MTNTKLGERCLMKYEVNALTSQAHERSFGLPDNGLNYIFRSFIRDFSLGLLETVADPSILLFLYYLTAVAAGTARFPSPWDTSSMSLGRIPRCSKSSSF